MDGAPPAAGLALGPLPPGRHHLTREVVSSSQRSRLLAAVSEVVGSKTYCEATVADVVARAGVSRRTFYEHFATKADCLLAAYDAGTEVVLRAIAKAVSRRQGWRARLEVGIDAFLGALASSPSFARVFAVEVAGAGDAGRERRQTARRRLVALYRELNTVARSEDAHLRQVTDEEFLLVVGGTDELIAGQLQRDVEGLPSLRPTVVSVVCSLLERGPPH